MEVALSTSDCEQPTINPVDKIKQIKTTNFFIPDLKPF
jgi:hypothetical protein